MAIDITAAPYNVVLDGAWAAATLTIATNVLSSPVALWSAGDNGKFICVGQAGAAGPQGGSPLLTTITSVAGDGKSVTLANNAGNALSAEPNVIVAWGATNNDAAFARVRAAFAGLTVDLSIPTGGTNVCFVSSGNAGGLFSGIKSYTLAAAGITVAGGTFQLGAPAQYEAAGHASRTQAVAAGASSVILTTPSEISRFSLNQQGLMTNGSLQFGGYPTNHQTSEFRQIIALDTSPVSPTYGKITFSEPFTKNYPSTLPVFNASGTDFGGPATLYAMNPDFDHTAVINGLTIAHHAQWSVSGLSITLNNCASKGLYGGYPTMAKTCVFNVVTGLNCTMEVDKYVESFSMPGCTWSGIAVQSVTPNLFTLDGTTLTFTLSGTSKKTLIRNGCVIGTLAPGPQYGYPEELVVFDSTVSNFGTVTFHQSGHFIKGGTSADHGVNVDFTMANGVIFVASSYYAFGLVEQWMLPGAHIFWVDPNVGTIGKFKILDVTQDGSGVYVHTDWTGGFPNRTYGVLGLWLLVHPAPSCTFSNVIGCPEVVDLSGAPHGAPLYSYSKRSYTGALAASPYWQLYGKIKKIVVRVPTQYTGATGTVQATISNSYVKAGDFSDTSFVPAINLKQPGTRTLDVSGGYPAAWTNGQSGDTLPTLTEALWSGGNMRMTMTDISSESAAGWPAFSIEFITDQGIIPASRTFVCNFG